MIKDKKNGNTCFKCKRLETGEEVHTSSKKLIISIITVRATLEWLANLSLMMGIKFQTVSDTLDFEVNFNSVRHHLSCSVHRGAGRDHGPKPAPERPSNSQMNI